MGKVVLVYNSYITLTKYTEVVLISRKPEKVVIGQYFFSSFKVFVHMWIDNMKGKRVLFSPQIFLGIFRTFIFLYQLNNN